MTDMDRLRRLAIDGDPEATAEYARWMTRRGDGRASCVPPLPPPPVTRPTLPWGAIHREKCASIYRVFGMRRSMRCQTPAGPTNYIRQNCPGYRRDCINVLAPVTLPWSLRCDLPAYRTKEPRCVSWNARDCLPVLGHLFRYRLPSPPVVTANDAIYLDRDAPGQPDRMTFANLEADADGYVTAKHDPTR